MTGITHPPTASSNSQVSLTPLPQACGGPLLWLPSRRKVPGAPFARRGPPASCPAPFHPGQTGSRKMTKSVFSLTPCCCGARACLDVVSSGL